MKSPLVDKIAQAVLYEGYTLYPYRPSVKSRQRWTFGGIYPRAYSEAQRGTDAWTMQTECLLSAGANAKLEVLVRFLRPIDRGIGKLLQPLDAWPDGAEPVNLPVESLPVGERVWYSWQEATELTLDLGQCAIAALASEPLIKRFDFTAQRTCEPLRTPNGPFIGVAIRRQEALACRVEVQAALLSDQIYKISVVIRNETALEGATKLSRDEAALRSMASTHTVLSTEGGQFLSLVDPPSEHQHLTEQCRNVGAWPVLVSEPDERHTMLSAPIILYDYPQIAPESPGDLFDGTEIDEILSLRVMTLTDAEKQAMRDLDPRTSQVLTRTENLDAAELARLHGTMRDPRVL